MKKSLFIMLMALMTTASFNVHAIPPAGIDHTICKDMNDLTEKEIDYLDVDPDKIISVDSDVREVCFEDGLI